MASMNAVNEQHASYESVYTNAKAGMAGVDKEKVKRIVYELSKVNTTTSVARRCLCVFTSSQVSMLCLLGLI